MMLHTLRFHTRFCPCFSYISLCKTCESQADPFLAKGQNFNNFGRGPLGDATCKISSLYALWFQTRIFLKFSSQKSIFSLCDLDIQRP